MLIIKELGNGKMEVSSDKGKVDIGSGPVEKLIIDKAELEYVSEIEE